MSETSGKIGEFIEKRSIFMQPKLSIAPMMDWTDRHCRFFLRGFSPSVLLYTEMIHAHAIVRGDRERLLQFHPQEHPVALQLGGANAAALASAALLGEQAGYDTINLNCGCPSDKVRLGEFGACLMREPQRVAAAVSAMQRAVKIPVTVKMRIGTVDGAKAARSEEIARFDDADYAALCGFISEVADAGCAHFVVHARKAVLGGFSPKDNREIPPLHYAMLPRLRRDFPNLSFEVNGGLRTLAAVRAALAWSDGVMLGREAYHRPMLLCELGQALLNETPRDEATLLRRMITYADHELVRGTRLASITRHMLGWFTGLAGARDYRRMLSEGARSATAQPELIWQAARQVLPVLAARP